MRKEEVVSGCVGSSVDEGEKILEKDKIEKVGVVDEENKLKGVMRIKEIEKVIELGK